MTDWRRNFNYEGPQSDLTGTHTEINTGYDNNDRYRRIGHFRVAGVEKQSGATGFAYGSERMYKHELTSNANGSWKGHKLDQRTSMERIKLKKQQQEVEENHRAHLKFKEEEKREKCEEKKKDLHLLQSYNPWSKPAGGAPRVTPSGTTNARMQKLGFDYIAPFEEGPYGKPGAGAPLRTKSGKVHTQIRGDRDIRFQDHLKKEVDDSMRYKSETVSESEGNSQQRQQDRSLDRVDSEKLRMIENQKKKRKYAQKLEEQCAEAIDRREMERQEQYASIPASYLWGKNFVDRDDSGKLRRRKWIIENDLFKENLSQPINNSITAQMGKAGCGAPLRDPMGSTRTKISGNNDTSTGQSVDIFDPWGKPGAGAPLRDEQGHIRAAGVYGKHTGEMEKRSAHSKVIVDKPTASRGYGIDVASWLRADVDRPKNTLTHAHPETGQGVVAIATHRPNQTREYYTDLQAQAEYRHKLLQQEKNADRQLDARHAETIAHMWEVDRGHSIDKRHTRPDSRDNAREARNKHYSDELRKAIEDKSLSKKRSKENKLELERQHISTFNQHWGRPGAGAPRLDKDGQLDALPKNITSMLESQVNTGRHFRNT